MEVLSMLCTCILVLVSLVSVSGSVILFDGSPTNVIEGLTEVTTLRCSLNDTAASASLVGRRDVTRTPDNVEQVTSIILMHGKTDVASVSVSHHAKMLSAAKNIEVIGDLTKRPGEKGFLQLTFRLPIADQVGVYSCEVSAVTPAGHTKIFTTKTEITMTTPTIKDLVNEVNTGKVNASHQQNLLNAQQQTINQQQITITQQQTHISTLESTKSSNQDAKLTAQGTKLTAQETKLTAQETKLTAQETKLTAQEAKISTLQSQVTRQSNTFDGLTLKDLVNRRHKANTGSYSYCHAGLESLRLVGGDGTNGAVELTYNGKKGFICDDHWDINEAHVVCRMLNYEKATGMVDGNTFYSGNINFIVNAFECTGHEQDLTDCQHDVWAQVYLCVDNKLAGVQCDNQYNTGHTSVELLDTYYCSP